MVVRAAELLRVAPLPLRVTRVTVDEIDGDDATGQAERRLDGFRDALLCGRFDHGAVDHGFDVVLPLLVDGRQLGELVHLAVDPHT